MARQWFKLLQGIHSGADLTQEPAVYEDPLSGRKTKKYPSKIYYKGDVFESLTDLLKLGEDKFATASPPKSASHSKEMQAREEFPGHGEAQTQAPSQPQSQPSG